MSPLQKISIITPSFNSLAYLKRCCASVADQRGASVEHILVDGASTDGTVDWLRSSPGMRFISESDRGMYEAVNKGLRMAGGEILAYLNCDEQYLPGTLSAVMEWFARHPHVDIAFGHTILIRPDGSLAACRKAYPIRWPYVATDHLYTFSCGMFFRRRLIEDGFFFREDIKNVADAYFVVRVLRAGYRAGVIDRYLSAYTMTGQNLSTGTEALDEANEFRAQAPVLLRGLRIPLKILRSVEKFVHGAYYQRAPFSYSVYVDGGAPARTTITVDRVPVLWPREQNADNAMTHSGGRTMARFIMKAYYVLSVPVSILFILSSARIHPSYRMSLFGKLRLGFRMFLNTILIPTGTSYKSHLAMALKILETPPEISGDVIECGTWKGGCAANLSLVCRIVGRKLKIYDSYEGLPDGKPGDREAKNYKRGDYSGSLEEVKANIQRRGAMECCEFIKGWFEDTLPRLNSPVLLAFLDVDLEESLQTCVRNIWPNLVNQGYIFIDEVVGVDYCALFYSEKWWNKYFGRTPPGLIGAGTGLPLGEYYIGPSSERAAHPMQHANAGAYTRKDMSGHWTYYPDEA